MNAIALVKGTVKNYDWGGYTFIPALLQVENPNRIPYAEYWLGVHPLADCIVQMGDDTEKNLRDLIDSDKQLLGKRVNSQFGSFPYLLKTLDVRDMLSIQVHPSKKDAEAGFALENARGIAADAPARNYRDTNHKPELLVALGDFWLLHGFKKEKQLSTIFSTVKELKSLKPHFDKQGYKGLYTQVMKMSQGDVNKLLTPLLDRVIPLYHEQKLSKTSEDFWAARAALTFAKDHIIDRGIISIYLFNLIQLKKGEAVYQAAGVPHAYLEGQNVEIMSNSDNVLRGGLTSKHIDVDELLRNIRFEATSYKILTGEVKNKERIYHTAAPDFELGCFELEAGKTAQFAPITVEMLLLTEGNVELSAGDDVLQLKPGTPSATTFPGKTVRLHALEKSIVYRASVPVHSGE
ncbi:MAG TPA: mannose-6-phosphate isomerase, class I [Chitinophagaceae bacterium]